MGGPDGGVARSVCMRAGGAAVTAGLGSISRARGRAVIVGRAAGHLGGDLAGCLQAKRGKIENPKIWINTMADNSAIVQHGAVLVIIVLTISLGWKEVVMLFP